MKKNNLNSKTLVIVESPSKAKKIQEYLGDDYIVMASMGHIDDLAKGGSHGIGVNLNTFATKYVLDPNKIKFINDVLQASKECEKIYLCPDPDREGESIAYHIYERIKDVGVPIKRVTFNEITKNAIKKSLSSPRDIDIDLVHAQEARRVLDRIVGFMASPFLMSLYRTNLSAGRVQSVLTKMVIDREREISSFIPEDYWNIHVSLSNSDQAFSAKYDTKITNEAVANKVSNQLSGTSGKSTFVVADVVAKDEKKPPQPPLITSKLQQIMSKDYGFSADRTMKAAQSLYEGGYCTYIRTDSTRASDDSIKEVRTWLKDSNYQIPSKANSYPNKDSSFDAHECIRPTEMDLLPWDNYEIIDPDQKQVYEIIWRYFAASQMNPAVYNTLKVILHLKSDPTYKVKASGKALKEKGFLEILGVNDDSKIDIPMLSVGEEVELDGPVKIEKKQTQPPPRYSEANLIKELVSKGIGRPATYAELLSKIASRNYVEKNGNMYHATDLGNKVTQELDRFFTFMDYNYTSLMEQKLDDIANKNLNYVDMLKDFYVNFKSELEKAYVDNGCDLCDKCSSPMKTVKAKNGNEFLSCSSYPICRNSKSIEKVSKYD